MTFSYKLAEALREKKISIRELAEKTGIPKSAIQRYTSGETEKIPIDRMILMAEALGIDPAYVMGWNSDVDIKMPPNVRPVSELHHQSIPHIGSVAAGEPIYAPDDLGVYVNSPVDCDAALTVQGDSMTPTYLDGDIVYIKCRPDVPEGAVAVVFLDDEATLKHVYKRETGLTLWSDNPAYPPMMIEFEDYSNVRIFGVPVGFTRIYKKDPRKMLKKGLK